MRFRTIVPATARHLVILSAVILFASCGVNHEYHDNSINYVTSFLKQIDEETKDIPVAVDNGEETLSLSFLAACRRAAASDAAIQNSLSEIKKAWVDIEEAQARLLPRLETKVDGEVPIDDDSTEDYKITGGLFFTYDIWKAVAAGDEEALRRALLEKNMVQLRLNINKKAGDLLQHLALIHFLDEAIEIKKHSLALADKGVALSVAYARENRQEGQNLFGWRKRRYMLEGEIEQLESHRAEKYASLKAMLRIPQKSDLVIEDAQEVMDSVATVPKDLPELADIWSHHGEARLAEIAHIAAEVNMKLAEMDRLPKIDASLGLGSIPLTSEDEEAASMVKLSVSMPLWDAGDHERKMAKARINMSLVRHRMKIKAMELQDKARQAWLNYAQAEKNYRRLSDFARESQQVVEGREKLLQEKRLSTIDTLGDDIEMNEVSIQVEEARIRVGEMAVLYRAATGLDSVDQLVIPVQNFLLATDGEELSSE